MRIDSDIRQRVELADKNKKVNSLDLSSDQDLTIAIMNLISIEEHLMFSGAKTGKHEYYDLINQVRDMRKNAMLKIIPSYEGEVWCISKHLLAAAMRVFEVGTKALASGDKKTAYELFDQSYELYSMFWGLNMGMLTGDAKTTTKPVKKSVTAKSSPAPAKSDGGKVSKLKSWVKNAVNCCIE